MQTQDTRPVIKDYFPEASLIDMHCLYLSNPELMAFINALENYIDYLGKEYPTKQ